MGLPVNWIAVVVCAVLGMLVPALWYAPKIFGNTWMALEGINPGQQKPMATTFALAGLCSLAMSYALAGFLLYFGSQTFVQGALAGAELWLGFVATTFMTDYRFAGRSWKLIFINIGHSLIALSLMGGILAIWK